MTPAETIAADDPRRHPIIYVRGYAGSDSEIEDTVAEPYMGFALGATKFRQLSDGSVRRHYFESPLFRLVKDYGYTDVYSGGREMPIGLKVGMKSVFIYRYYDEQYFGDLHSAANDPAVSGSRRSIEDFAEGLGRLILRIRDRICDADAAARETFRVYLVAHSMGGLVCRCFLQNRNVGGEEARKLVDKVFTYATPHNGIDFNIVGNVPAFFSANDATNFNRERMAQYLGLRGNPADVSNLNGQFDVNRFFCLVGTNWRDYEVASGWSRRLIGPMSDGLVRIANAAVFSQVDGGTKTTGPRAFVDRSHSGHYGIVNSEEGYQNLVRFLFGDVRVDGVLEVDEITLPTEVADLRANGEAITAAFHFETIVRVRGADWELHRRMADDESAIFRSLDDLFGADLAPRRIYLFSTFLACGEKVKQDRASLGFAIDLGVLVPEYEVKEEWLRTDHYKGSYLFRDTVTIEATPKADANGMEVYDVAYGFNSVSPNQATTPVPMASTKDGYEYRIPLSSDTRPGMTGTLVLTAREWN